MIIRKLDKNFLINCYSIYITYCYNKANILLNVIVLVPFFMFQIYDIISCDILCDCDHVSFFFF